MDEEKQIEVGDALIDPYGRRFVVKSMGSAGVVIDRAETDALDCAQEHYVPTMDLAVDWDNVLRGYARESAQVDA